jgi:hypothetical protein
MVYMATISNWHQQLILLSERDKFHLELMGVYSVFIFVIWNIPILKQILYPFKLVTTAFHEIGHALVGILTGATVNNIFIDHDTYGSTTLSGGNPYLILPAGYLSSSFWGGLIIFGSFDSLATQVISILSSICFLLTIYWSQNWIPRIVGIFYLAFVGILFWYDSSELNSNPTLHILSYMMLFVGVMLSLQTLWDFQGLVCFKDHESDPSKYAELVGCCPAQVWSFIWLLFGIVFMVGWTTLGIMVFPA